MSQNLFNNSLIIGLGLIGGSFAKALKSNKISNKIFAFDVDNESIELAKKEGIIENFVSLDDDLSNFDLIVIATPLLSYEKILKELAKQNLDKAVIIDLGSLKNFVVKILPTKLEKNFIGCHPIAGLEKSRFENSNADLFLDKKFIICKDPKNDQKIVKKVEDLAVKIGFKVDFLEAKKHDEIYALVSHLPQFLSFLMKEYSPKKIQDDFFTRAFRLDNSGPEIWEDIFKLNEQNLEKFYLKLFDNLEKISQNLETIECSYLSKLENENFDEEFFETNFAAIFFRVLIVVSYLEISEIKSFSSYAGSGFKDFTSIVKTLNYDPKKLNSLIKKNRKEILNLVKELY